MRTTGIQVSGYGFLLRRLELALVIGDPRMAHDPLRSQRRAVVVGVLISLLIAGGAAMVGLLRPVPAIGEAQLVVDEQGSLHVRLDDGFHPITNVASARLVLGQPIEASDGTSAELAEFPLGSPLGIALVPGLVEAPRRELVWCEPGVVVAAESVRWHGRAILTAPSGTWLVDGSNRFLVDATAPRALGTTPVEVSDRMVEQFHRGADVVMPQGKTNLPAPFDVAGRVLTAGERAFLATQSGVVELRGPRRALAESLSRHPSVEVSLAEAIAQPAASALEAVPEGAPGEPVQWAQPELVCMGERGLAVPVVGAQQVLPHGVGTPVVGAGPGNSGPAYVGPRGSLPVATERGLVVISETGMRFGVGSEKDLKALGFSGAHPAPWRVVQWLPDGGLLSAENARTTSAAMSTAHSSGASSAGTL